MAHALSVWFGPYILKPIFSEPVDAYVRLLIERVIPLFADPEAEQERIASEFMAGTRAWADEADAADRAYEFAQDAVTTFIEMRELFLATGVVGLFHLFERQLVRHLNHEMKASGFEPGVKSWGDAAELIGMLTEASREGPTVQEAFRHPDMQEMRNVAHAVKHGDGKALRKLHDAGAVVVSEERLRNAYMVGEWTALGVRVAIDPEDVLRYAAAIHRFWNLDGLFSIAEKL